MKRIQTMIVGILAAVAVMAPGLVLNTGVAEAATTPNSSLCKGILATDSSQTGDTCASITATEADNDIKGIVTEIVDILLYVVGVVSVIMIIIGGLRYITSSGDSSNVTAAKNTILYAIVGLVIVIFAKAIVAFVFTNATT